jgi:hypothetical protein
MRIFYRNLCLIVCDPAPPDPASPPKLRPTSTRLHEESLPCRRSNGDRLRQ